MSRRFWLALALTVLTVVATVASVVEDNIFMAVMFAFVAGGELVWTLVEGSESNSTIELHKQQKKYRQLRQEFQYLVEQCDEDYKK